MSHKQNESWLEAAKQTFDEAVETGNLALAKDVIADVQDAGFLEEARTLNDIIREKPVSHWSIKSPYTDL